MNPRFASRFFYAPERLRIFSDDVNRQGRIFVRVVAIRSNSQILETVILFIIIFVHDDKTFMSFLVEYTERYRDHAMELMKTAARIPMPVHRRLRKLEYHTAVHPFPFQDLTAPMYPVARLFIPFESPPLHKCICRFHGHGLPMDHIRMPFLGQLE